MKTNCFIAQGRKRINPVLIAAVMLVLCSCAPSNQTAQFSMAPPPPPFDPSAPAHYEAPRLMAFSGDIVPLPANIQLSGPAMHDYETAGAKAALRTSGGDTKCKLKDRFDRKVLIAYQWDQNRVSLAVKGINMQGVDVDAVKLEYRLRLQPEVPRKERCRYQSHWQGLLGSGYNEFFVREKDTVWERLDEAVDDVEDGVGNLF